MESFSKSFSGKVVHGDHQGRKLGFPTINMEGQYDLPYGVYASKVTTPQGVFKGALHYGPRPVFNKLTPVLEIYLLDFEGDLYGITLSFEVSKKLREVQNFDGIEALKKQIEQDVQQVRELP